MTPPHHDVDRLLADIRTGSLRVTRRTSAIALLLHGGRSVKTQPDRFRDISYLRMLPFGMAVMRASRGRVAPYLVHNTHGGWIASSGSGLVQARALVRGLSETHGLPVVLLGHSSGGWAALRIADEPGVAGAVALAPWVDEGEGVDHLVRSDAHVRVIHGESDTVCSPVRSRAYVERAVRAGVDATFEGVPGGNHAMLDRPWRWHRRAGEAVTGLVPGV